MERLERFPCSISVVPSFQVLRFEVSHSDLLSFKETLVIVKECKGGYETTKQDFLVRVSGE